MCFFFHCKLKNVPVVSIFFSLILLTIAHIIIAIDPIAVSIQKPMYNIIIHVSFKIHYSFLFHYYCCTISHHFCCSCCYSRRH